MARVALLDGDSFAHRCAAAVERTKYCVQTGHGQFQEFETHAEAVQIKDGVIWKRTELGDLKGAINSLESAIERSIARARGGIFHVYLGGSAPTFRDHISRLKRYKGNRTGTANPAYLPDLRRYLIRYWGGIVASGEEVDDVLSYVSREIADDGGEPVIVGNDKDLDQIPGEHYDWVKDKLYTISHAESRSRMWMQVLSGDVADNIGGCFMVGASRAKRIVDECIAVGGDDGFMWRLVCEAYAGSQEKTGCPYVDLDPVDVALENYNLVRLRQSRHEKHEYRGLFVKPREVTKSTEDPVVKEKDKNKEDGQTQETADRVPKQTRGHNRRRLGQAEGKV